LKAMLRIDLIRLAAGYISVSTLTWLLTQKVSTTSDRAMAFLVGCNGQAQGIQWAKDYAHTHPEQWTPYRPGDPTILLMNFNQVQLCKEYDEGRVRLVLVKMTQRVKKCHHNKVRYHSQTRIYSNPK